MAGPVTSLTSAVKPVGAGAHVTAAMFLDATPVLALGDGTLVFVEDKPRRVNVHADAAILVATKAGKRLITGGDGGRVYATGIDGQPEQLADEKGKWIDAIVGREDGSIAWSAGREVRARDAKGAVKTFAAPSTVRGLAYAPKGYRVAIAHYNGATLWFPNAAAQSETLEWKGAHLDIVFSLDGRFLVTTMQENALHGWRLSDKHHMRMSGYPAKPRSLSWSADGYWLATSGADACIVWPFKDKDGPMNKAPRECGVRDAKVSCVAFHPKALVVAIGYGDGWILLCRLTDAAEILVRRPAREGDDAVSALAWNAVGSRLLFGTTEGEAGILDMPA